MLDYIALGILIFAVLTMFYGVIAIHDIPYEIAKHRNHPHQDAINVAGWVSLLTAHIIWPFLWIWATLYREDRGWGFGNVLENKNNIEALEKRVAQLEQQIAASNPKKEGGNQ